MDPRNLEESFLYNKKKEEDRKRQQQLNSKKTQNTSYSSSSSLSSSSLSSSSSSLKNSSGTSSTNSSTSTYSHMLIKKSKKEESISPIVPKQAKNDKIYEKPNNTQPVIKYSSAVGLTRMKNTGLVATTVNQYEKISEELGIRESKKPLKSKEKIKKILQMLGKLAKIEIEGGQAGMNFSADVIAELKNFYDWVQNPNNFTEQDKDELEE